MCACVRVRVCVCGCVDVLASQDLVARASRCTHLKRPGHKFPKCVSLRFALEQHPQCPYSTRCSRASIVPFALFLIMFVWNPHALTHSPSHAPAFNVSVVCPGPVPVRTFCHGKRKMVQHVGGRECCITAPTQYATTTTTPTTTTAAAMR